MNFESVLVFCFFWLTLLQTFRCTFAAKGERQGSREQGQIWALLAERGFILLVHWFDWYDWYEWNIIHSIGIALVNCILLWGLRRISKNIFSVFGLARFRNEEYTLYLACV